MKKAKRILCVLLLIVMAAAMLTVMAYAEEPAQVPANPTEAPVFIEYGWEIFAGLVVLAIVIIAIIKFAKTPRKEQLAELRGWLLQAVIKAEQIFGSKTGEAKLSFVYDMFVCRLPWLAKVIPFEKFKEIVDDALGDMQKLLEKKPDLLTEKTE